MHALLDGKQDQPMALKIMAKSHIIESDQQIQVMREKQALMTIPNHPFIVELYATYQVGTTTTLVLLGVLTQSTGARTATTCTC